VYKPLSIFLFFSMYILGLLTNNPSYSLVGQVFTLGTLGVLFLIFLLKNKFIYNKKICFLMFLMFFYPFIMMVYYAGFYGSLNSKYVYINFQFFLIFIIFLVGMQYHKNDYIVNFFVKYTLSILLFLIPVFGNGSIVGKQNIFASIVLMLLSFILFFEKKTIIKVVFVLISAFMIIYADARSSMMALIMMVVLNLFYNHLIRFKNLVFGLSFILAFSWIFLVVYLYMTGLGDGLNNYIFETFDKRLYSGRERMWGDFVSFIGDAPLFGYGLGMNYNVISNEDYSTHNVYLATLLQQGIVGLIILLSVLWVIYSKSIINAINSNKKSLAFILVPPILLQQNFELSMTQNNMSFMIIFWFFLGISVKSNSKKLDIR